MKQSCKILQSNTNQQILDQIHEKLDDYKRKFDRELGRIHDICDAIGNPQINNNEENLRDEILEALLRSPTYSSLEQHIYHDDKRSSIRIKPREKIHPRQKQISRSSDAIKRKASQPIKIQVIDTTTISVAKRRSQIDAFKRSRSFTNVEHTETQLGMDYIEEDESDLSWKPFGPKKTINNINEQSVSKISTEKSTISLSNDNENSSDEEFDIEWQRRVKQKARKEAVSTPLPVESPAKRTVRFSPSTNESNDHIELYLDETTQDGLQQINDQNNNKKQTEIVNFNNDDDETTDIQSQITTTSTQQVNNQDDNCQIIDDNANDEIIALSDDEIYKTTTISRRKSSWTTSEIQITTGNSQSQSLHNPYRIGIADPSLRSVFLPPPPNTQLNTGNKRTSSGSNGKSNNKTKK